jgi:DNA-binding NarL/FixJ family response regulator
MLDIGIEGFISKQHDMMNKFSEALYSVMQGVEYLGSDISQILYRIYTAKKKTTEITPEFTPQEKRILELCRDKLMGKEIADKLNISLRTVDNHKKNIFRKFNFNSAAEAVQYAMSKGII